MPTAAALTVRVAIPETAMLAGLRMAVRPGEDMVVRETMRWNTEPAMIVIVEVPEDPGYSAREVGLAVIAKSCFSTVTVTVVVVEWDREPLVPVMVAV